MKTLPALFFAGAFLLSTPLAFADDIIISPEVGVHFHDHVKVKKYKSHKWDGDAKVGVVITGDDVEYYDVPEEIIVEQPSLRGHRYVYINEHIYVVNDDNEIVALVD
jgi:hypothetical protein